jgi:hypothetical protein
MKLSSVLPIVAGVASGILAVLVTSHWSDAHRSDVKSAVAETQKPSGDDSALRRRIEHLEARQLTRDSRTGRLPLSAADPSAPGQAATPASPESDERPSADQYFAGKLAEHKKEAVDPDWAQAAQKSLGLDVERVVTNKKLPVRVLAVHCATVSCTVELEWPSFSEATRTYAEFVHTSEYSKTCTRGLMLPEPQNPAEQYRATLLLNCEEDRTGSPG